MIAKVTVGACTILLAAGGLMLVAQPAASTVTLAASLGAQADVPPQPAADRQRPGLSDDEGPPPAPAAVAANGSQKSGVAQPPQVG